MGAAKEIVRKCRDEGKREKIGCGLEGKWSRCLLVFGRDKSAAEREEEEQGEQSCGERGRGRVLCSLVSTLKMSENGGNGDGWFGRVWGR